MEEKALISEVSREERREQGDEQEEEGEQPALRTSISSASHALSPGAAGLRRHCTGPATGPATNTGPGIKEESTHISCSKEP